MTTAQIKTMNGDQCIKAIRLLDAKADVAGRSATKAENTLIKKLQARIHEIDPDRED